MTLASEAADSYRLPLLKIIEFSQLMAVDPGADFALQLQTDTSLALAKIRDYFQPGEVYVSTSLFKSANWHWSDYRNSKRKFEGRCWLTSYRLVLWVAGQLKETNEDGQKVTRPDGRNKIINIPLALISQIRRKGIFHAANTIEFKIIEPSKSSLKRALGAQSDLDVLQKNILIRLPRMFDLTFFESDPGFIDDLQGAQQRSVSVNYDQIRKPVMLRRK